MKRYSNVIGPSVLALALAGLPVALRAAAPDGAQDSEQVSKLLSEAKTQAVFLREDATTMEMYTRSTSSWEVHAATVTQMKEHINAAGRTVAKLDEARNLASPWQEIAIDRIKPLLKEMAANTEAEINYISKNPRRLEDRSYRDYIEANADVADKLAGLISDFVSYGNTKNRLEKLTTRLEVPER